MSNNIYLYWLCTLSKEIKSRFLYLCVFLFFNHVSQHFDVPASIIQCGDDTPWTGGSITRRSCQSWRWAIFSSILVNYILIGFAGLVYYYILLYICILFYINISNMFCLLDFPYRCVLLVYEYFIRWINMS